MPSTLQAHRGHTKGSREQLSLQDDFPGELHGTRDEPSRISIYLPTHPESQSETINEDEIRFKNIVAKVEDSTLLDNRSKNKSLEQLRSLKTDIEFWSHQKQGLGLFIERDEVRYAKLPYEINPFHFIGTEFILSPLHLMKATHRRLFVIDINLDEPKLYEADASTLQPIEHSNLPPDLKKALQLDEFQQNQQFHTGTQGKKPMFHGHGGADDNKDIDIENYLRLLAKRVDIYMQRRGLPLVLAGVKERVSFVRKLLHYKPVLEDEIPGNHEAPHNKDTLYPAVQNILASLAHKDRLYQRERYQEALGNTLAIEGSNDILVASEYGLVDTLYAHVLRITKDSIRPGVSNTTRYEFPADITLFEKVVSRVRSQGGDVIAQDKIAYPHKDNLSAILRHRIP